MRTERETLYRLWEFYGRDAVRTGNATSEELSTAIAKIVRRMDSDGVDALEAAHRVREDDLPSADEVEAAGRDGTLRTEQGSGPDGAFTYGDLQDSFGVDDDEFLRRPDGDDQSYEDELREQEQVSGFGTATR